MQSFTAHSQYGCQLCSGLLIRMPCWQVWRPFHPLRWLIVTWCCSCCCCPLLACDKNPLHALHWAAFFLTLTGLTSPVNKIANSTATWCVCTCWHFLFTATPFQRITRGANEIRGTCKTCHVSIISPYWITFRIFGIWDVFHIDMPIRISSLILRSGPEYYDDYRIVEMRRLTY